MSETEKKPFYKKKNFSGHTKLFAIISATLILLSILSTFIFGVEIAIEFKGGTIITYSYSGDIDTNRIADSAKEILNTPVNAQIGESYSGDNANSLTLSFSHDEGSFTPEQQAELLSTFQGIYPEASIECLESNDVSPSAGSEFFLKCIVASIFAAILIVLYVAIRFNKISGWSAGVSAICALIQDLVLVYGAFVICGFEINANFMAVILTILGYSVNDTIVIYDRIRENQRVLNEKTTLAELLDISQSQSFRRTLRTSISTIAAMLIVTIFAFVNHLDSILSFSLPMIVGMASGTYSSLCVAPSIWYWWNTKRGNKTIKDIVRK